MKDLTTKLFFEELEAMEEPFWDYVAAGAAGVVVGVVLYVGIAAAT